MNHQSIDARFNAHTNPLSLFTKDAKKIAFAFARDAPLARSHRPFDDPCLARATNWSVARRPSASTAVHVRSRDVGRIGVHDREYMFLFPKVLSHDFTYVVAERSDRANVVRDRARRRRTWCAIRRQRCRGAPHSSFSRARATIDAIARSVVRSRASFGRRIGSTRYGVDRRVRTHRRDPTCDRPP